jgi:hypothetical protein
VAVHLIIFIEVSTNFTPFLPISLGGNRRQFIKKMRCFNETSAVKCAGRRQVNKKKSGSKKKEVSREGAIAAG